MKTLTVINAEKMENSHLETLVDSPLSLHGPETMDVSDGYHTMADLYEHRIALFRALCKVVENETDFPVWKSTQHSDGSQFEGWFLLGMGTACGEQITYHLPMTLWDNAPGEILYRAPLFDGHTSKDVLERLKKL